MEKKFHVTGMSCSACTAAVERSVSKLPGVTSVNVNLLSEIMYVEFEETRLKEEQITEAVHKAGYEAKVLGKADDTRRAEAEKETGTNQKSAGESILREKKRSLVISIVFTVLLMYVSMGHMVYDWLNMTPPSWEMHLLHGNENAVIFALTQLLLALPVLYLNRSYFQNGFKTLFHFTPNMDSLIAIGSTASLLYGIFALYRIAYGLGHGNMNLVEDYRHNLYFESSAMILTLISVGKYLESKSKKKTTEAITGLLDLTPKTVCKIVDGEEITIKAAELLQGDFFVVRPGESVAVDGIVVEGESYLDESAITGESVPVAKRIGDTVISATLNRDGLLKVRATKVGSETTLAKIIQLVEEATTKKAPIAKLADKISGVFVPIVIAIAVITGIIWVIAGEGIEFALSNAVSVLVISCPCALGLATPVAIMVGTGRGAVNGILMKSAEALERLSHVDTVVLDKTGTVTEGKLAVTDIYIMTQMSQDDFLSIAASLEMGSEHPIAHAVIKEAQKKNLKLMKTEDFRAVFGKGVIGVINRKSYIAGNEEMMQDAKIVLDEESTKQILRMSQEGKTPLLFADDTKLLGIIGVSDIVKESTAKAVEQLHKRGLDVWMCTGDNEATAVFIANQVGISHVKAKLLPEDKEKVISELRAQGHKVAMVGDGINDAPALVGADVGIAIGAGTDVAIESADVVLMKSDLKDVVKAFSLSQHVMRNIKENLFWAFFYNSCGIPLAAGLLYPIFGWRLNPMFAAAAMSLSSICVVTNALRLRIVRLEKQENVKNEGKKDSEETELEKKDSKETELGKKDSKETELGKKDSEETELEKKDKRKTNMKITIGIDQMACEHCSKRVHDALMNIDGVESVEVSLSDKCAEITLSKEVAESKLKEAIIEAGYEVRA